MWVQITCDEIGSYMSITLVDKRIGRDVERSGRVEANRKFESTLLPGTPDNQHLREVLRQLSKASPPKNVAPSRRKVETETDALTVKFYARKAEDFTGGSGRINPRIAAASARVFRFEGRVTITRHRNVDGGFFFRLEEGPRSLSIGQRGTEKTGFTYTLLRSDGFVPRTNRVAGRRSSGRGPRAESE